MKGNFTGGKVPMGYKLENKKLVIDEKYAEIVKDIFYKYSIGFNATEIAKLLNDQGILTNTGTKFDDTRIYLILHRKYYTGKATKQGVEYDNIYPRIISDELWGKVNAIIEENKQSPSRNKALFEYILSCKSVCGYCKRRMNGDCCNSRSGIRFYYYVCPGKRRDKVCNSQSIRKEYFEDLVLKQTQELIENKDTLNYIVDNVYKCYIESKKENYTLNLLQQKETELKKSANNIVKAIEMGMFNEMTKQRFDEIEQELKEIQEKIAVEKSLNAKEITKEDITKFLTSVNFENLDKIETKKLIINTLVREVIVYKDQVIITYNFIEPDERVNIDKETTEEIEKQCETAFYFFIECKNADKTKFFLPINV